MDVRPDPIEIARRVVAARYPGALCAIAGGSIVRGESTATSDIDLLVIDETGEAPLRESFVAEDWPVEAFVHTRTSALHFFRHDARRGRPSLPLMASEGVVLLDRDDTAAHLQSAARATLTAGPDALSDTQLEDSRYSLTDLLDDFIGCEQRDEGLLLAAAVAEAASSLLLQLRRSWIGLHKWTPRAVERHDPALRAELAAALEAYASEGKKEPLIAFAERALGEAGGRCFDGYRRLAPHLSEAPGV